MAIHIIELNGRKYRAYVHAPVHGAAHLSTLEVKIPAKGKVCSHWRIIKEKRSLGVYVEARAALRRLNILPPLVAPHCE